MSIPVDQENLRPLEPRAGSLLVVEFASCSSPQKRAYAMRTVRGGAKELVVLVSTISLPLASNSPMPRPPLDGLHFDLAIIGGGINGVAVARECARAGKRVLLVEQHDFSSGTTSRATRIIHGGLRYLEHGEISLVRESLRERERLLHENAHLVRPLNFLLALPPD